MFPVCAGYAAIHYAAMVGNADLVRFLVMHGEDIDRPFPGASSHRSGCSPLMLAMEMSGGRMTNVIDVSIII